MTTFKQFLEADGLDLLPYEMFFRKMGLSKAGAKAAVVWAVESGKLGAPQPSSIPDDGWQKIFAWASSIYSSSTGNTLDSSRRSGFGPRDVQLTVKGLIAREMRKHGLELMAAPINEADDLEELNFDLALRKEFKMSKEQARETIRWLRGDVDWEDLEHGVRDVFIDIWDPSSTDRHPGMSYGDHVMDEVHMALKKYNLDTRDLL